MLTQVVDLGVLKFGRPSKFNLIVKNSGNNPITVNKVSVGCTSCTKAKLSRNTIGAGEEALVEVEFTPGTLGQQRKSVTLSYDGGSLKMEFTANVES
jgi:hypothetical protein